jgi:hypothetical protein
MGLVLERSEWMKHLSSVFLETSWLHPRSLLYHLHELIIRCDLQINVAVKDNFNFIKQVGQKHAFIHAVKFFLNGSTVQCGSLPP